MIVWGKYMIVWGKYIIVSGKYMILWEKYMIVWGKYMIVLRKYMIVWGKYMIVWWKWINFWVKSIKKNLKSCLLLSTFSFSSRQKQLRVNEAGVSVMGNSSIVSGNRYTGIWEEWEFHKNIRTFSAFFRQKQLDLNNKKRFYLKGNALNDRRWKVKCKFHS